MYVFDEPTIGLHPRDVGKMITLLHQLRDKGNPCSSSSTTPTSSPPPTT
jgi:hypothetical protein